MANGHGGARPGSGRKRLEGVPRYASGAVKSRRSRMPNDMTSTAADHWAAASAKADIQQQTAALDRQAEQQADETARQQAVDGIRDAFWEDVSRELAVVVDQWQAAGGRPALRLLSDGTSVAVRASDGVGSTFGLSWDVVHVGLRLWTLTPRGREEAHVGVVVVAGAGRLQRAGETLSVGEWIEREMRDWLRAFVGS